MIRALVWVGVGVMGAAGAYARFTATAMITRRRPAAFPWGTFSVNLTGGFALGVLTGLGLGSDALLILGTGFLGGYTTFSTWMVESQRLGEDGDSANLLLYLMGSMLAGVVTTGAGWALAELIA
jgi:fluoride exporter